ncbi:zinc finger protein 852-like [Uranotaenia lowii]|uniref:zinc finger protein 852-like n=1 Tax=Uranotaenia lowii TaxID=190385 RepID=UPI002478D098|nr:zinc finger protein 852-like [Uranotaenia lowii]
MPKNYLSFRYDPSIQTRNDHWDDMFCRLFWSPFESVARQTRSGQSYEKTSRNLKIEEVKDCDPVEVELNYHDDWIELEYSNETQDQKDVLEVDNADQSPIKETPDEEYNEEETEEDLGTLTAAQEDPPKPYRCEKCMTRFQTSLLLRRHWLVHEERPCECEVCGKTFKTRSYLSIHRRNMGHHNWTISCPRCGKMFAEQRYLGRHNETACNKYINKRK